MYIHQWVGKQSVTPATRGGRGCYRMSVSETDDMKGQWGSSPDKLRQRAQFAARFRWMPNTTNVAHFSVLIPEDWEYRDQWVTIIDMHGGDSQFIPWSIHVANNELLFTIAEPLDDGVKGHYTPITIIKEQWYDFTVTSHLSATNGYHTVVCNGVEIADFRGVTLQEDETQGAYFKMGPYVHTTWDGVTSRTMYGILDSFRI